VIRLLPEPFTDRPVLDRPCCRTTGNDSLAGWPRRSATPAERLRQPAEDVSADAGKSLPNGRVIGQLAPWSLPTDGRLVQMAGAAVVAKPSQRRNTSCRRRREVGQGGKVVRKRSKYGTTAVTVVCWASPR